MKYENHTAKIKFKKRKKECLNLSDNCDKEIEPFRQYHYFPKRYTRCFPIEESN